MISKIIVPREFLEYIRQEGKTAAKRNKETFGFLLGVYNADDGAISVSEIYPITSNKNVTSSFFGRVYDNFLPIINIHKHLRVVYREEKFRTTTPNPSRIVYHSHPSGTWSIQDLQLQDKETSDGFRYAQLLYRADTDGFEAIEGGLDEIEKRIAFAGELNRIRVLIEDESNFKLS